MENLKGDFIKNNYYYQTSKSAKIHRVHAKSKIAGHTLHIITVQNIIFDVVCFISFILFIAIKWMFAFKPGAWSTHGLTTLQKQKEHNIEKGKISLDLQQFK